MYLVFVEVPLSLVRYSDFIRIKRVDVFLLLVVIVVIMGSKAC